MEINSFSERKYITEESKIKMKGLPFNYSIPSVVQASSLQHFLMMFSRPVFQVKKLQSFLKEHYGEIEIIMENCSG